VLIKRFNAILFHGTFAVEYRIKVEMGQKWGVIFSMAKQFSFFTMAALRSNLTPVMYSYSASFVRSDGVFIDGIAYIANEWLKWKHEVTS